MIRLGAPWALALLLALVPLLWLWRRGARRPPALLHGDLALLRAAPDTWRVRLRHLPRALRIAFLVLATLALAGPQAGLRREQVTTRGVDIVIVLDRSTSMRAMDLEPHRLAVAQRIIGAFVDGRPHDRHGLVAFAREAYTACPLTLDHGGFTRILGAVDFAERDEDGTAIGLGLAAAVNRLRASDASSRVVVLVTDGQNNAGEIAPPTAADLAAELGIRVYTIGVGTHGFAPMAFRDQWGRMTVRHVPVEIDEDALRDIAARTEGAYFRADSSGTLEEIFARIDELETSELTSTVHVDWSDRFEGLLLAAGLVFLGEVLVARFLLGRLP